MSSLPSILVLGAGELGLAILSALAKSEPKPSTTVLLRREPGPPLHQKLQHYDMKIEYADIVAAPSSHLADIFRNFDVVIGATGMTFPPGTQRKLAEAAVAAAASSPALSEDGSEKTERMLRLYVPWQMGVDYDAIGFTAGKAYSMPLFDEQLSIRHFLRSQTSLKWVVVSVGVFTEFFFSLDFGVVVHHTPRESDVGAEGLKNDGGVVRALGSPENCITVTSTSDVGRVVAYAALHPPSSADKGVRDGVVRVAGSTMSYTQLADALQRVRGGKWRVEQMGDATMGDDMMGQYRRVFSRGVGVVWDESETWEGDWEGRKGLRKLQTVGEWMEEKYNLYGDTSDKDLS